MRTFGHCFSIVCIVFCIIGCSEQTSPTDPGKPVASKMPVTLEAETVSDQLENESDPETEEKIDTLFIVDHYDPKRDAVKDLDLTIELAEKSGKRILIEVGGKW